ncbi:YhgE/Pip domain-containing protein [Paenibacillus kandeliae]|uniref:YhgE/Pip domain-containing protein n=1 Tax=Paenibacillus kandeliae TaxID=3231269 RepID=UPI00345B31D1
MKNIWTIYKTDWKNLFSVSTGILLVIAIMLLPSVYAWFNIKAMWDPYSNTSGIIIAVTNQDKGTKIQNKQVNVGDQVVANLKKNNKLGWTFVDEKQAQKGLDNGNYYATILIPSDFSEKIGSILTDDPVKPQIVYTVNEKISAIAPKITDKGATTLTQEISEEFIETASEAVLTKMQEAGIKLEEELPTIRNIENKILTLEARLPEINQFADQALELEKKLPQIDAQAQKIVELQKRIPEIEQAGQMILKVEDNLPKIKEAGNAILELQKRLPDIRKAANKVNELDQNFYKVEDALDQAITDADKLASIISTAQQTLPKVQEITSIGSDFADKVNTFLDDNDGAFDAIAPVIRQNLVLLQQTADATTQLVDAIDNADIDPQTAIDSLSFLETRLTRGAAIVERITDLLTRLNNVLPNQPLTDNINRLNNIHDLMERQIGLVQSISQAIQNGQQPAKDILNNLRELSTNVSDALGDLLSVYDSKIVPDINEGLDKLKTVAKDASDVLNTANNTLPDIAAVLSDAQSGVQFGQQELARIKNDLPTIRQKLHDANELIQSRMDQFTELVNTAAAFVNNDLPKIENKIHEAADFVRDDLPKAEQELTKISDLIQNKLPEAEDAVHKVGDFVRNDLPGLEKSVRNAADKVRVLKNSDSELSQIIKWLKGDIQQESDFLSSPVELKQVRTYPIPNYGSSMSPFYTTLSIWVGGMLLISMFKAEVDDPERRFRPYQVYFGRLATFMTIGLVQAFIIAMGDIFILGAYVASPIWFVTMSMLISMVFVTLVYTLVSVFGNIGKGLAIILLVLQFSSSGGTFPVSMTGTFFQAIHPWFPFTYAVELLRETVGGMLMTTVYKDIMYLIGFVLLFILFALLFKKPLGPLTEKMAQKAKKTKMIP